MLELIEAGNMAELYSYAIIRLAIVLVCWLFVVVANFIDFISGKETAKAIGTKIDSRGYRRTFKKIKDYYMALIFFLMFDILASLLPFYILPFGTLLASAAVFWIEGTSVLENSRRRKSHAAEIPEIVKMIVQCSTAQKGQEILDLVEKMVEAKKAAELTTTKEPLNP